MVDAIKSAGGDAVANYDSVATMDGGENIVKTALDNFGRLDIVVTPAGILRDRMVFNMTESEWDDVIAVHLKGTFTVSKFACILFRQQRSGCIITFSSTSGLYGNSGQSNYGAAKDGIAGFTRAVARDMGRYGARVNSISPGANSRMTATVPDSARQIRASSGMQGASAQRALELRREPEDIAPFVAWLASDDAKDVNRLRLPRHRRRNLADEQPGAGADALQERALERRGNRRHVPRHARFGHGEPGAAAGG